MKIVQILASRGYGGLERHFVELSIQQSTQHQVHCIAAPEFSQYFEHTDVVFHSLDLTGWRYNPQSHLKLSRILTSIAPDIIHAQANKAASIVRFHLGKAKASVATLHNQKKSTSMFKPFDAVIAVSDEAKLHLSHSNTSIINNGIQAINSVRSKSDTSLKHTLSKDQPLILTVGRLVDAKGFDLLIPAMKGINAQLCIAGTGPDHSLLEQLIVEQQLDNITLLGYRNDVEKLMSACDLLVISSRKEGFPYVLIEALHNNCIILSTRIPGAEKYLPERALIQHTSISEIHQAIQQAISQIDTLTADYQDYHSIAQQELTLAKMTEKTLVVYKELLT